MRFFGEMLQTISERGRALIDRARDRRGDAAARSDSLVELCDEHDEPIPDEGCPVKQAIHSSSESVRRLTLRGRGGKVLAVDVQQRTRNTTEVHDRTEWRIWYQKN